MKSWHFSTNVGETLVGTYVGNHVGIGVGDGTNAVVGMKSWHLSTNVVAMLVGSEDGIQLGADGDTFFKMYEDGMLIEEGKNDGQTEVGVGIGWN
jgi:hypothetical protein